MYNWNTETLSTIKSALRQNKSVFVILHENIGATITQHKVIDARLCDTNPSEIDVQFESKSFIPITERDIILIK